MASLCTTNIPQLDAFVREREATFCMYHPLSIEVCSWNIDSRKPSDLEADDPAGILFIEKWVSSRSDPDVIVIGFQELVDLELVRYPETKDSV